MQGLASTLLCLTCSRSRFVLTEKANENESSVCIHWRLLRGDRGGTALRVRGNDLEELTRGSPLCSRLGLRYYLYEAKQLFSIHEYTTADAFEDTPENGKEHARCVNSSVKRRDEGRREGCEKDAGRGAS